ncbi:MAG TPA: hypothetical protein VM347_11960 [Nonomuraea sp.]|nr:hypothetical protein [Nonomuraea sp.]
MPARDVGAATRLIDRREKGGNVRRVPDPADRRKVIVEAGGRPESLDEVLAGTRRRLGEPLSGYPEELSAILFDFFHRAASAYQEATDELINSRKA